MHLVCTLLKESSEAFPNIFWTIRTPYIQLKGFSSNSPHKVHPNFAQNLGRQFLGNTCAGLKSRERKISPNFSCIKFLQIRDVPTQIPGHPGHSLSKTTEKGHLHKVFVRDIPTSGSGCPRNILPKTLSLGCFFPPEHQGMSLVRKDQGKSKHQGILVPTGTCRKAFFRKVSAWFWTPPPQYACLYSEKMQIHWYRPLFFPIAWPF